MKTLKRVLAIVLSVLAVLAIGYLLFTCSRVNEAEDETSGVEYEQTKCN